MGHMITTAISEIFETLARQLGQLNFRLGKFELDSVKDEAFEEALQSSLRSVEQSRAAFRAILDASDREFASVGQSVTTAGADSEALHWRTQRLIKYVSRDLYELWTSLTSLQQAIGFFYLPDESAKTRYATLSATEALSAATEFTLLVTADLEIRFHALARFYAHTESPDEIIPGEDPEVDAAVSYYDKWRPEDIHHLAPAELETSGGRAVLPQPPTSYRLVPVLFATDREKVPDSSPLHVSFRNGRAKGLMTYGLAEVSIPRGKRHRRGKLERPSLWKLQFREDPEKHITILSCEDKELPIWTAIAQERLREAANSAALIFIHGFNVSFDDAIRNAAQIGWDLTFNGLVAAFSWSSEGEALAYAADEDNARLCVPRLLDFFDLLRNRVGVTDIHVMAHSMGNLLLIEALRKMKLSDQEPRSIQEVVLAAPDYDADEFRAAVGELKGKARRYTLYGSEKDLALVASKSIRKYYPRAGDGGSNIVVVDGVETIDATSVGEDLLGLGHSYFSSKPTLLSDINYVIKESLPPWRRDGLAEERLAGLPYWLFRP
jgi:esterase/lipase superfamily enzyme